MDIELQPCARTLRTIPAADVCLVVASDEGPVPVAHEGPAPAGEGATINDVAVDDGHVGLPAGDVFGDGFQRGIVAVDVGKDGYLHAGCPALTLSAGPNKTLIPSLTVDHVQ